MKYKNSYFFLFETRSHSEITSTMSDMNWRISANVIISAITSFSGATVHRTGVPDMIVSHFPTYVNKISPADIIADPDYIFKDKNENTALAAKTIYNDGSSINIVLRLVIEGENPNYKNSIITAVIENNKRFSQRFRNKTPVYKRLDKTE